MNKDTIPMIFRQLQGENCLLETDILNTRDGFYLAYKSLADILAEKNILDVPGSAGNRLLCSNFFDDWFLYAVPAECDHTYSLLKLREQEYDAQEDVPADGDTPGVTISFISFDCGILLSCLDDPTDENRKKLDAEINRVVARRGQSHHKDLKRYFVDPRSEGPYLVAAAYIRQIASFARDGCLDVPQHYKAIVKQSAARKGSKQLARLPRFIASLNQAAGYVVCDNEKICIADREKTTLYESAAILATHTGNTSLQSFAAEVEFHARFLTPVAKVKIPLLGRSLYDSAIRADMSVGDAEFQGPAPFYQDGSKLVKRQYALHQDVQNIPKAKI